MDDLSLEVNMRLVRRRPWMASLLKLCNSFRKGSLDAQFDLLRVVRRKLTTEIQKYELSIVEGNGGGHSRQI